MSSATTSNQAPGGEFSGKPSGILQSQLLQAGTGIPQSHMVQSQLIQPGTGVPQSHMVQS